VKPDITDTRKRMLIADGVILLSALIWGGDYIIAKDLLETVPPGWLNAVRFTTCAVLLFFFAGKRVKKLSTHEVLGCALTGLCMFGGFFFQTGGLKHTTVGNNAFIVSSYVIFVPFIIWLIQRKRPGAGAIISAVVCVTGIALLTLNRSFAVNIGDLMTLGAAVSFAFEIVLISIYARRVDPLVLAFIEALVVALCFDIYAPLAEPPFPRLEGRMIFSMLYLTFLGATATHIMVTLAMKYTSSVHASIICSLESVFGIIMAVIFMGEVLTGRIVGGCILVFSAVILTEVWNPLMEKLRIRRRSG